MARHEWAVSRRLELIRVFVGLTPWQMKKNRRIRASYQQNAPKHGSNDTSFYYSSCRINVMALNIALILGTQNELDAHHQRP